MTVIEACEKLYNWFSKHDYFQNLNAHFKELCPVSESLEADKAAILAGLNNLEKLEMISSQKVGEQTFWVLKRPYSSIEQNVSISAPIANLISQFINSFCNATNNSENLCDPSNIGEKDISFLLFMLNGAIKNQKKPEDES